MMKKFIIGIFIFLLLGLSLVTAADTTDLEIVSVTSVSGNPGESVSIDVVIKNNHAADSINTVNVASSDLTLGANNISAPASSVITNLETGDGNDQIATLSLTIPSILAGGYIGTISISDAGDAINDPVEATYVVTVNTVDAIDVLTVDEVNALEITGQEDQVRTVTFQVKNSGSTTYTPVFSFNQADFNDGDKNINLDFTELSIAPGDTGTITVRADIPNNIDVDTYSGIITVSGGSATDTFKLKIRVHPEVCKDGPVGDSLRLDVNDPDNGDDFAPGDIIDIDVTVENDGSKDLDVIVEVFLYNVDEDDEIERVESDEEDIDDGDDFDFDDLELEIPLDNDVSEDDDYILFIKAFEDGDEDDNCVEEQINIEIEREKHDVRIERVNLVPSSARPGEFVDVSVSFINVGSKDEDDVFVRLTSNELGWDETSNPIDIDDGESKDNDGVARFSLLVPRDVAAGEYSVLAVVNFDDGDEQSDEFATFTVLDGAGVVPDDEGESSLRVQSVSDTGENVFSASVAVVNDGVSSKTYDLSVTASWAEPVDSQAFTVNGGDSRVVQILIAAKTDTVTGSYSGIITLKEDGIIVDSESFDVAVTGEAPSITGLTTAGLFSGAGGTALFIIVDIVLIVIAVFFIRLIFKSGNKKKKPKVIEKVKL